jgi:hypothetical protein
MFNCRARLQKAHCLFQLSNRGFDASKKKEGNTLCEDAERLGRPAIVIDDILSKFFAKYRFASAKIMLRHFGVRPATVKGILIRELGFKKYTRRSVPYLPDAAQKRHHRLSTIELIKRVRQRERWDFNGITTEDESWF